MAGIHLLLIAATLAAATPHPQATSAGLQPPAGFLALDACVDWGDATCTLSELLGRGFPGARLSWSRSLLRYEGLDGPGEEVVWKVTIAPTTGRPVVLDLSRTCSERALEEGTVHLPVVEIDQVDGADSLNRAGFPGGSDA